MGEAKGHADRDTLELVLTESIREQQQNTQAIHDLVATVNKLTERVGQLQEQVSKAREVTATTDTRPIERIVEKGCADMKLIIGRRPAPVIKKYQLLLFPEQDAKLFYKIVFGRWFLFLVIMLFLTYLYQWAVHQSDNRKEIIRHQAENDTIQKAWILLYRKQDKAGKKFMDQICSVCIQNQDK